MQFESSTVVLSSIRVPNISLPVDPQEAIKFTIYTIRAQCRHSIFVLHRCCCRSRSSRPRYYRRGSLQLLMRGRWSRRIGTRVHKCPSSNHLTGAMHPQKHARTRRCACTGEADERLPLGIKSNSTHICSTDSGSHTHHLSYDRASLVNGPCPKCPLPCLSGGG